MVFPLERKWASLHVSSQQSYPFPQARQSHASPRRFFFLPPLAAIIEDLDSDCPVLMGQANTALPCTAVADHVGHPFAYRPGECGIQSRWKGFFEEFDLRRDPRCTEELPGSLYFACKLVNKVKT
jgi:hypothetical protein